MLNEYPWLDDGDPEQRVVLEPFSSLCVAYPMQQIGVHPFLDADFVVSGDSCADIDQVELGRNIDQIAAGEKTLQF